MKSRELLEGLFDDKKIRILRLFVNDPEEEFYLREAAKAANVPPATTYRIINQLLEMNLIEMRKIKKTKLYKLSDSEKTKLLKDLLGEKKNAVQEFVDFVSGMEGVEKILLHGKESKDKTNILIIGEDIESRPIKEKVGEIKSKYKISIIELTLEKDQFTQMSTMGLFPHSKKVLWSRK